MNIGGYSVLGDFTRAGGGRCEWAFAERDDIEYFLKCFLSPKQVVPGRSRGSAATIAAQQARCDAFEARQNKLLEALTGKSGAGGNLIAPIDFFSYDGRYYKVTEKVEAGISTEGVGLLPVSSRLFVLRSAANSIRILHSCELVHGDVKADNIIVRDRGGGKVTSSIIDFDDSYFSGSPPMPPEELTFDPPYAAPEVFRFIADPTIRNAATLGTKADVFSLGVVFCEYIAGRKPIGVGRPYLGEALILGGSIDLPSFPPLWETQRPLVARMLALNPSARPDLTEVLEALPKPAAAASTPPHRVTAMGALGLTSTFSATPDRPRIVLGRGVAAGGISSERSPPLDRPPEAKRETGETPRIVIGRGLSGSKRDP